jgi:hypothetical protein
MASSSLYLFPQEGLNVLLDIIPRGTITVNSGTNYYVGLFSTTWSTIEAYGYTNTNVTLNSGTYPVAEISGTSGTNTITGYNRIQISGINWGAPTAGTTVIGANTINVQQSVLGNALTFTCTSGVWPAVNGMFLATWGTLYGASNPASAAAPNLPNIVLWYAPFADGQPVTLSSGDALSITPTYQSAPYPA